MRAWREPRPRRQATNERAKITTQHLLRQANAYLRQSSPSQVEHNPERQYALAGKAREFGWPDERILVIDEDLGLSGAGERSASASLLPAMSS